MYSSCSQRTRTKNSGAQQRNSGIEGSTTNQTNTANVRAKQGFAESEGMAVVDVRRAYAERRGRHAVKTRDADRKIKRANSRRRNRRHVAVSLVKLAKAVRPLITGDRLQSPGFLFEVVKSKSRPTAFTVLKGLTPSFDRPWPSVPSTSLDTWSAQTAPVSLLFEISVVDPR